MPTNFTATLPADGRNLSTGLTDPQYYDKSAAPDLINALGQAGTVFNQLNDQKKLAKLQSDVLDTAQSTANYKTEQERILNSLATEKDRQVMGQLGQQLDRLQQGQIQGAFSPGVANLRMQQQVQSFIAQHPHLLSKAQQILSAAKGYIATDANAGGGGDGSGGTGTNPVVAARNHLITAALEKDMTVPEYLEAQHSEEMAKLSDAKTKALALNGQLTEPAVQMHLDMVLQDATGKLGQAILSQARKGNLVKESFALNIEAARQAIVRETTKTLAMGQTDENGNVVATYSSEFRKQALDRIDSEFKTLNILAQAADTADGRLRLSEAYTKIQKNADFKSARDVMGPWASLIESNPTEMVKFITTYNEIDNMVRHNAASEMESALALGGDPYKTFVYEQYKSNGGRSLFAKMVGDNLNPKTETPAKPSGNPMIDKGVSVATIQMIRKGIAGGHMSFDEASNGLMKLAKAGDVEAFDKSPDLFNLVRSSEPLKKELDSMAFRVADDLSRTLDPKQLKSIVIDPKNANSPFQVPQTQQTDSAYDMNPRSYMNPSVVNPGNITMSPDLATTSLVNHLNASYRIAQRYKSPVEALTFVDKISSDVLGARVDAAAGLTPAMKEQQQKEQAAAAAKPKKKPAPPPTKLTEGVHYDDAAGKYIQVDKNGQISVIDPFQEFSSPKR